MTAPFIVAIQRKLAVHAFQDVRAEFWRDAAARIRSRLSLVGWLEALAAREPHTKRGRMALIWTQDLRVYPEFTKASAPYLPPLDRIMLQAAEDADDDAAIYDLLAEQIELTKEVWGKFVSALAMPLISGLSVSGAVYVYGAKLFPEFASIMPLEDWQPYQATVARIAMFLASPSGLIVPMVFLSVCGVIYWSLENYVGKFRDTLDKYVFPWSVVRSLRGLQVTMVIATMIKAKVSWRNILTRLGTSGSTWIQWQVNKVGEQGRTIYAADPLAGLGSGLVSEALHYRLMDYAVAGSDNLGDLMLAAARDEHRSMMTQMDRLSKTFVLLAYVCIAVVLVAVATAVPSITMTSLMR